MQELKEAHSVRYNNIARIETTENKQRMSVPVVAMGVEPLVRPYPPCCPVRPAPLIVLILLQFTVSPADFTFGECPVNERRDLFVTITNRVRPSLIASLCPHDSH